MSTEKSVAVLNTLIKINNDRIRVYDLAQKATHDIDLHQLFDHFQSDINMFITELESDLQKLNSNPVSFKKKNIFLEKMWLSFKLFFDESNREDLLNTLEYDEFVALNNYKSTLVNNLIDLDTSTKMRLKSHYKMLETRHDKLKELGDLMLIEHKYDKSFTF
ncbi:PA2169 family four-helix-bundle protein [Flavobacterium sp. I-SCBP12n]|uniref:PA2169 family four-helix-bundle protein n=1 Tax=Flavobacterium pygoscelis TaxID=2893176 RepID=A0A9X1XT14_9FLAO|nr:DUF2383 domain-containing protein [Flavobacterium pygoscelis]MCK8142413.1 PA2169 family four-helix-bundle protein [Flavobacterium pygoscelis]